MQHPPRLLLPIIIFSGFGGNSIWFAGNAVVGELQAAWGLVSHSIGWVTSAVQLGFIVGTLTFAFFAVSDRWSPCKVFFTCSVLGALANLSPWFLAGDVTVLLTLRFATGFFLAGIYPVGMKIAASWYREGLGRALGYLVGALVLGTAFPHLLRGLGTGLPWQWVLAGTSFFAFAGGVLMLLLVRDGPYLPKGSPFDPGTIPAIFRSADFRASVFGYFGHMWELYAFWAFVPVALAAHGAWHDEVMNIPLWSFLVMAAGVVGCVIGGSLSMVHGNARVAMTQLGISGLCCLLSPLMFLLPAAVFLPFMLIWGITVVGDSPQFSTLNANNAPREYVGTALTMATAIGFLVTIFSIQLLDYWQQEFGVRMMFLLLLPGPVVGLLTTRRLLRQP